MSRPQEILDYLGDKGKTPKQVSKKFGITEQTVARYLRNPEIKGLVEKYGNKFVKVGSATATVERSKAKPVKRETLPAELISTIMDNPLSLNRIKQDFGVTEKQLLNSNLSNDIHILEANKTKHAVILSVTPPPSDHMEFKGSIFKRRSGKNTWKVLTDSYVKSQKWSNAE